MKKIFFLLFLFFVQNSMAVDSSYGLYTGINYGTASDDGSGAEQLSGSAYGINLGYRWIHWGLEFGYTQFDVKSEGGQTDLAFVDKAEIQARSIDFLLRAYFWRFFTAGIGFSKIKAEQDFRFSNILGDPSQSFVFNNSSDYSGSIIQLGLVLPLFKYLDLQFLYELRSWSNDDPLTDNPNQPIEPLGGDFQKLSGQLVYYFN